MLQCIVNPTRAVQRVHKALKVRAGRACFSSIEQKDLYPQGEEPRGWVNKQHTKVVGLGFTGKQVCYPLLYACSTRNINPLRSEPPVSPL
jgi:hypothetical protein